LVLNSWSAYDVSFLSKWQQKLPVPKKSIVETSLINQNASTQYPFYISFWMTLNSLLINENAKAEF
tara:strand:+ start:59 stop:256 length:198 start_codon:yes stop_codon:yes gene_type:complete